MASRVRQRMGKGRECRGRRRIAPMFGDSSGFGSRTSRCDPRGSSVRGNPLDSGTKGRNPDQIELSGPTASLSGGWTMAERWRRCSACKSDIALGAIHWVCSVSTCNRKRTALVFCNVDCWEVHLPTERRRFAESHRGRNSRRGQPLEGLHQEGLGLQYIGRCAPGAFGSATRDL